MPQNIEDFKDPKTGLIDIGFWKQIKIGTGPSGKPKVISERKAILKDSLEIYYVTVEWGNSGTIEEYMVKFGCNPDCEHKCTLSSRGIPPLSIDSCLCRHESTCTSTDPYEFNRQRDIMRELKVNDETIPEIYAKFSDGEYKSITDRIAEMDKHR